MLNMKIEDKKIIFTEQYGIYSSGYTINIDDLSLQDLQKLRDLTLKTYYKRLQESIHKEI